MNTQNQLAPEDIYYFSKLSQLGIEEWMPIPDYEDFYEVSNLGSIRRLDTLVACKGGKKLNKGRVLKASPTDGGYKKVTFCKKGERSVGYVHKVVASTFLGQCPFGLYVCHNNGIRSDNRLFNLRFDTPKNNQADREKHGTTDRGSQRWNSKLTEEDIPKIRSLINQGEMLFREIAELFGVSRTTIGFINSRRTWKHVD